MKNVKITMLPYNPGTTYSTKVLVEAQSNNYVVEQDRCRGFSLSVIDKESGSSVGLIRFNSFNGEEWKYQGLRGAWNRRELAEILGDKKNQILWVSEYQAFLAQQLKNECKN